MSPDLRVISEWNRGSAKMRNLTKRLVRLAATLWCAGAIVLIGWFGYSFYQPKSVGIRIEELRAAVIIATSRGGMIILDEQYEEDPYYPDMFMLKTFFPKRLAVADWLGESDVDEWVAPMMMGMGVVDYGWRFLGIRYQSSFIGQEGSRCLIISPWTTGAALVCQLVLSAMLLRMTRRWRPSTGFSVAIAEPPKG